MSAPATNLPPPDVDPLRERLAETHAALIARTEQLVEAADRVPAELDDVSLLKATDFVAKQLKPHRKALDAARVVEKEAFLSGCRVVDGLFGALTKRMNDAIASVETSITALLRQRAAEERKRREEEAERQRAEAEAAAASIQTESDLDVAIAAERAAVDSARQAQAKPADLVRTHGAHGGVATLTERVAHEIIDRRPAAATLWRYLDVEALDKAARARIRDGGEEFKRLVGQDGFSEPGVRYYIEEKGRAL